MSKIIDFTPEAPANPYEADVQALIEAGEGKATLITAPRGQKRDGTPGNGQSDRLKFQQAANAKGYTARVRKETVNEADNTIDLIFTLTEKHNRGPRAAAVEAPAEAPEAVEAPEADAPEAEPTETRKGRK